MKRKSLILIMIAILILVQVQVVTAADAAKPSQWAEAEINAAIENKLVPEELKTNYQEKIKRFEYVLLALKVYDISGKDAVISNESPFTDTTDHLYEPDIIRAYNAGIIKGDGKGSFHPDNYISREEIASLVVNLLKQISPDRDYTLKSTYQFNDRNKISDWATYYIDYCYENKILNGYNGNIMDPKGNATIEQSIALLYRLANTEHLLESVYGTLKLSDNSLESDRPDPQIVNQFVETYGPDTFNILKQLSNNQNIGIMSLWAKSTSILVNKNTITLNSPEFEKNMFALVHEADDELFITSFTQLLGTFDRHQEALQVFNEYIIKMKANEELDTIIPINNSDSFGVETLGENNSQKVYKIFYVQKD